MIASKSPSIAAAFPCAPQLAQLIKDPQWHEYGEQYLHGCELTCARVVGNQGRA